MRKYPCEKCGTRHRPSRHHILPRFHFGGYGGICWLCEYHHREIEAIIMVEELRASKSCVKSRRFKLPAEKYVEILNNFLGQGVIEYTFNLEGDILCTVSLQC